MSTSLPGPGTPHSPGVEMVAGVDSVRVMRRRAIIESSAATVTGHISLERLHPALSSELPETGEGVAVVSLVCALCVRAGAQECYNASPSLLSDPLRHQCSPVPRPASLRISREFWSWTQIPCFPDGQWSHGLLIAVLPTISVCGDAKTWVNCPDNCHCDHCRPRHWIKEAE